MHRNQVPRLLIADPIQTMSFQTDHVQLSLLRDVSDSAVLPFL